MLVAVILTPPVAFLERLRLPRWLAIVLVLAGVLGIASAVAWTVLPQFVDLTYQLPGYGKAIEYKVDALKGRASERLGNATDSMKELETEIASSPAQKGAQTGSKAIANGGSVKQPMQVQMVPATNPFESVEGFMGPLTTAVVVVVFAIFILAGREDLRNRLIRLTSRGRLTVMTQAMDEALTRINRYLFMQMLVNAFFGTMIGVALHFLGVPKAALWGLAAGVLRYLPYIGWPMAALMPVGLALAVFPGWWHAILTGAIFVVLELVVANGIEPVFYGSHIGLAPLAILVSAVFWTMIWGFPGLLLSTPLTVCLMVVGRYVPRLEFLSILLGNEPAMDPHALFYQRLLAGDALEARQILEAYLRDHSPEELAGAVVIPALGRSEQDGHRNELDEETRTFINSSTREIMDELADSYPPSGTEQARDSGEGELRGITATDPLEVLCVPARDEADDVVAAIVARLLERHGLRAHSIAVGSQAEMLAQMNDLRPETVCISALPPLAMNHTRALYAKIRMQFPALSIIVCFWHVEGESQRTINLARLGPRDRVLSTVPELLQHFARQDEHEKKVAEEVTRP